MWHFVKNRTYWIQMKTECIFSSSSPYPFHSRMAPPIPRCCWCYLRCNKLALKWSGIGFQLLLSLSRTIFYRTRMSESKGGKLFPYYWQGSTKMSSWLLLEIWYVLQCGQKKFQKEQFFHTTTYFHFLIFHLKNDFSALELLRVALLLTCKNFLNYGVCFLF